MKTLVVLLSHAQSTAHTYFTGAVKSDVVHLIMVCWAFLLRSFGAEQICHTWLRLEIFAHACVDVTPISTPFARIHMRSCQTPMALFPGLVVCWALLLQSFRAERIVHTRLPTDIFARACVEVQSLSVPLCASLPATKHRKLPRPFQFEVFCFHTACHGALVRRFQG